MTGLLLLDAAALEEAGERRPAGARRDDRFPLQLSLPVAKALQREALLRAILSLGQSDQRPGLTTPAPKPPNPLQILQSHQHRVS